MRIAIIAATMTLTLGTLASADPVAAAMSSHTNIPAQDLGTALRTLAADRHLQILYTTATVADTPTAGAVGEFTVDEALTQLLGETHLTFLYVDDKTITVIDQKDAARLKRATHSAQPISSVGGGIVPKATSIEAPVGTDQAAGVDLPESQAQNNKGDQTRSAWSRFRLAQTSRGDGSPEGHLAAEPDAAPSIEEIIVTAQKRNERLQDVPVPVTVLNADALVNNNSVLLKDYYSSVPGLSVTTQASGSFQTLSIRGITTGVYANPTVGITVDDVPFGTSTSNGGGGSGQIVPDIDPADLARIEVLRGPQGSLYGASSMGGLLKFVTADPSTEALSGRMQADVNGVYHGAETGYGVRGSVNVPVSDVLAVRASVFVRQDPGYIDNVLTGQTGVNDARASGGRVSALWRPRDGISLKLNALYQDIKGYGQPEVDVLPGLGDLQQSHLPGTGGYDRKVQAYSATATAKFGSIELTSITGYNVMQFSDSYDLSFLFNQYTQDLYGVAGAFSTEKSKTSKFTQEFRLSTPLGQRFDWLLGGFYTYEKSPFNQQIPAAKLDTGEVVGIPLQLSFPSPTFAEAALFTDLTAHITDRFDIQIGGRESQIRQTFSDVFVGALVPKFYGADSPYIQPELDSKADAFTYLVTPRFKISSNLMVYGRLASGYRAGGPNYSAGVGTPGHYDPDKTYNYEIGVKGDLLGHLLSVDASVYYIDWRKIQLNEFNPDTGLGYFTNAGQAKSQGVELSVSSRPLDALQISAWIAYDDAVLKAGFPANSAAFGTSGDRLPYSGRFSGHLSVEQEFPISGGVTGFAGGAVSYVGNRQGEFTGTDQRQYYPGYAKTDLSVGAKYGTWRVNLFVNNVTDQRGQLYGGVGGFPNFGFVYIQPRTLGLSLTNTF